MKHSKLAQLTIALLAGALQLAAEAPAKHIRLIVDTSMSLHQNDPSGYVKLATELFYDLATKLVGPNDSIKVGFFDPKWPNPKNDVPKSNVGEVLAPGRSDSDRASFRQRMREIPYDGPWTYFSPGVQWAHDELKDKGSDSADRVIVLITDGLPDEPSSWDLEHIKALRPLLRQKHIRVYVLAFGPDVHKDWFDNAFQFGDQGVEGETFVVADAGHLLINMLDIFGRSFGYARTPLPPSTTQIDVAGGSNPERAVVVALYQQPGQPEFQLSPPPRAEATLDPIEKESAKPDAKAKAEAHPVSYAYQWVVPPHKGNYGFSLVGPSPVELAVLRPIRVESSIRSYNGERYDAVMAGKPANMEVLVKSSTGGDPGESIRVYYYLHYGEQSDTSDVTDHPAEPSNQPGRPTPEGRVFVIHPQFSWVEARKSERFQKGYIEVEVRQFNSPLDRMGARMQFVRVFPFVSIRPSPSQRSVGTVKAGDSGCAQFQFQGNTQNLNGPKYTMGVRLLDPPALKGAWRKARFTLDGSELKDIGGRGPSWGTAIPFKPGDLNENHTFCVVAGVPQEAEAGRQLTVHFGLMQDPYDGLNVVDDLLVTAGIAAPDFWQTWSSWLMLLLTMLLMYLLYLLWRMRLTLPPDLAVSLANGPDAPLTPAGLADESFGSRWLGLPQDRPVISLSGDQTIGWVRPLRDELFVFRPGQGFGNLSVENKGSWTPVQADAQGAWLVTAGKTYRAGTGDQTRLFRLDYAPNRPMV